MILNGQSLHQLKRATCHPKRTEGSPDVTLSHVHQIPHYVRDVVLGCLLFLSGCDWHSSTSYQGYVEADNLYLASPYAGLVMKRHVVRGQFVKKGQLLITLDTRSEHFMLDQAVAIVEEAKNLLVDLKKPKRKPEIAMIEAQNIEATARLKFAALRLKRFEELYKAKATDRDHLDEALYNKEVLEGAHNEVLANLALANLGARKDQIFAQSAKLRGLSSRVDLAAWQLEQKNIYAPVDAIVFDTYFSKGEFVGAEKPVVSLLDPNNIRIEFFVPARDLPSLTLKQTLYFTCEGCAESNKAVVSFISPEAEYMPPLIYSRDNQDKIVFRVKAIPKKPTLFKPGQPVIVKVLHA
ncbi:MAG: HlyD family secretion protein [Legionellaceae bacterium]